MTDPQTFGDLKRLVLAAPRGNWTSRVNPAMTHDQALDILAAGLAGTSDETRLDDTRRGFLYKRNVLRECDVRQED
jgi:hypothetical protein